MDANKICYTNKDARTFDGTVFVKCIKGKPSKRKGQPLKRRQGFSLLTFRILLVPFGDPVFITKPTSRIYLTGIHHSKE